MLNCLCVCVPKQGFKPNPKKSSPKNKESNHTQEKGFIFVSVMTCCSYCFCSNRLVARWTFWHASLRDPELLSYKVRLELFVICFDLKWEGACWLRSSAGENLHSSSELVNLPWWGPSLLYVVFGPLIQIAWADWTKNGATCGEQK